MTTQQPVDCSNDYQMIMAKLRQPKIRIDKSVFKKSTEEKILLMNLKNKKKFNGSNFKKRSNFCGTLIMHKGKYTKSMKNINENEVTGIVGVFKPVSHTFLRKQFKF